MSARQPQTSGPFSIMAVLAMIVVGIVTFSAFLVLLAFADDLRNSNDGREHALSQSAVGFAGIASLMSDRGHAIRISRGALEEASDDGAFVVLSPPVGHALTWQTVNAVYADNLIVLPKWQTRPQDDNPLWVDKIGLVPPEIIAATIAELASDIEVTRASGTATTDLLDVEMETKLPVGPIDRLQTISGEYLDAIVTDPAGNIILGAIWDEDTDDVAAYVLSDPDLLNTHGLSSPITARTSVTILEKFTYEGSPIAFDVTLHGLSRSRNMLQLAFTPPFLPAVLCLVFAGALIAVVALAGNPRTPDGRSIPFGKRTLVDNTAKLVAQAGRNAGVAERYVAMIRRQAIRALGLSTTATEAQQAATLDALHRAERQPGVSRYSELAGNVAKANRAASMLKAMRRIYKWKQELGRERNRR